MHAEILILFLFINIFLGVNNGVFHKLKEEVPHLILIRCVCHSIQLAVSKAVAETLPRNLEFLVSETYNWFSRYVDFLFLFFE